VNLPSRINLLYWPERTGKRESAEKINRSWEFHKVSEKWEMLNVQTTLWHTKDDFTVHTTQ
jgi:hypothetical protein